MCATINGSSGFSGFPLFGRDYCASLTEEQRIALFLKSKCNLSKKNIVLPKATMSLTFPFMTWMRHVVLIIVVGAVGLMFAGCAATSKHVVAPSTVGSNRAIAGARQSNQNAQRYNDLSRTNAQRIEAKGIVVKKYWDTSK